MLKTAFPILVFDACWNMPCISPAGDTSSAVGNTAVASEGVCRSPGVVSALYKDTNSAGEGVETGVTSITMREFELLLAVETSHELGSTLVFFLLSCFLLRLQGMVVDGQ